MALPYTTGLRTASGIPSCRFPIPSSGFLAEDLLRGVGFPPTVDSHAKIGYNLLTTLKLS